MLQNTFIHLPHIGLSTEERFWKNGIVTWQDLLDKKNSFANKFEHISNLLTLSKHKLRTRDVRFFADRLVSNQQWRLFPEFRSNTAYLDIETTGLGGPADYITTISLFDGEKVFTYVQGKNLEQFKDDINKYNVLVTYNGKCFDVPFIEREFNLRLDHVQLDLRYILKSLGYSGGLKSCEHQLGLSRGDLEGIDGYFAVLLWKDYQKGNQEALDTLLAYNIEDTINLERLMMLAFEKKLETILLDNNKIDSKKILNEKSKPIKIPYHPDSGTIKRLKNKYY